MLFSHLVNLHLIRNRYVDSTEQLQKESGVSLRNYEVADNMDLLTVMQVTNLFYMFES